MCECIEKVNMQLMNSDDPQLQNTLINLGFRFDLENGVSIPHPIIAVSRRNPRVKSKLVCVFPTYCPFCGEKYNWERMVIDGWKMSCI